MYFYFYSYRHNDPGVSLFTGRLAAERRQTVPFSLIQNTTVPSTGQHSLNSLIICYTALSSKSCLASGIFVFFRRDSPFLKVVFE